MIACRVCENVLRTREELPEGPERDGVLFLLGVAAGLHRTRLGAPGDLGLCPAHRLVYDLTPTNP